MVTAYIAASLRSQGARRAVQLSLGSGEMLPQHTSRVPAAIDSMQKMQKSRRARLMEGRFKGR